MTIEELVEKYKTHIDYYKDPSYNETLLRNDFLNPFFELLGWDIKNSSGKPTNEREVILEEGLKENAAENSKKPDYTFRLYSERKFFLEAKKPSISIESDPKTAKQVRRYGFTAKLKISVISNFEYLAIYDCSQKVNEDDSYNKARIKIFHFTEYEDNLDKIKEYIGRESVYSGKFDSIWESIEKQIQTFSVDDLFLKQISEWRLLLGQEIYRYIPDIDNTKLNDLVQSYLNSIIFLRVCEDRNLEKYQTLLMFANDEDFQALINKFYEADKKYNSGLFDQELRQEIIENSQSVFWLIIKQLYYPESPYSFSVFSSDILGNIYEIFISQRLEIKEDTLKLEDKPERVERDIITTPTFIIQDILKQTVVPFCQGKDDEDIFSSKFADIACGSGAFLLETFQLLNDWLIDYYQSTDISKLIQTAVETYRLPLSIKTKLLKSCIYGVDKDYNAVEAAKFGLLLKILENEDNETIDQSYPILPNLEDNILYGNSLINTEQVQEGKWEETNPIDIGENGFDVIVGNPPYMKSEDMKQITPYELPIYKKFFKSAFMQFDKYFLFIERGLNLLNQGGYLGYIVPSKFTKVKAGKNLRKFLKNSKNVEKIISFGANQIFHDKTTYTCLLVLNKSAHTNFEYFEVKNLSNWKTRDFSSYDFEKVDFNSLEDEVWVLVPAYLKPAYNKINSQSKTLKEIVGEDNIINGIQTSKTSVYIIDPYSEDNDFVYFNKEGKKWKIEKKLTRPYFKTTRGQDRLYTYRPFKPNRKVIYPYKKTKNGVEFVDINELFKNYPEAYKYLHHYKDQLNDPERDIQPEPTSDDEWYRYGRHQHLENCDVPEKIIVGVLSQGDKYAIDYHHTLISSGGTAGYCIITLPNDCPYSIYYIQAILNSKYLEWYASLMGEIYRGAYIARGTKVLKRLPIREINFTDKDEKNVHDKIADIQKKLIDTQEEIDENQNNRRKTITLKRFFNKEKKALDEELKNLFDLGEDDKNIPLIEELYGAD